MRLRKVAITLPLLALGAFSGGAAPAQAPHECFGRSATIVGSEGAETIAGTSARDVIVALGGDDRVSGLGRGDRICGGTGDDRISGKAGADRIDGGDGFDTVDYRRSPRGVSVRLDSGRASGEGRDVLRGIENVRGSRYADLIRGTADVNVLDGSRGRDDVIAGDGADVLLGGAANDYLSGAEGDDTLRGGSGRDACRQGAGAEAASSCELAHRPERENPVFFYQRLAPEDLPKFENASVVVLSQQRAGEQEAVAQVKSTGAKAFRYVQFYWYPAGEEHDGIDISEHMGWAFCHRDDTPLVGRVTDGETPWYMIDANERGAYDAIAEILRRIRDEWGYDGVFFDRGGASLHSLATLRKRGGMWWQRSTCTRNPVVEKDTRFSDAYVRLAKLARRLGLEVLFNYGGSPFVAPRMRPNPRKAACRERDWERCEPLADVWPVATNVLYEGASFERMKYFEIGWTEARGAERGPTYGGIPKVFGLARATTRSDAFYKWARARLFHVPLALNTGDDCFGREDCTRWGTYPELTQATLGEPIDRKPSAVRCDAGSSLRCLWIRRYEWGLVALNATASSRSFTRATRLPSCRYVYDVYAKTQSAGGACTSSVSATLPKWSGRVYLYDPEPWSEPATE